jgi:hypothetical protein
VPEEYEKTEGGTDWKMVIVGAFDPATKQLPKEILDRSDAKGFDAFLAALRDRPLKKRSGKTHGQMVSERRGGGYGGYEEPPFPGDDDIPF